MRAQRLGSIRNFTPFQLNGALCKNSIYLLFSSLHLIFSILSQLFLTVNKNNQIFNNVSLLIHLFIVFLKITVREITYSSKERAICI